ncbi:hypothetical protein HNQ39_001198 [Armatimonas rosea]|uniref:Uncharacterized protein n=1 Tax=Armatimonas rosea TaxID=685828 RepID=A0A7W9SMN0_ARMRO|nr:hypothetical protein [Armatimonas rosea]
MGESVDFVISYEFQMVEGKRVKGECTSGWLSRFHEGGPILIVYLPDDPSQNEPFLNLTHEPVQTA